MDEGGVLDDMEHVGILGPRVGIQRAFDPIFDVRGAHRPLGFNRPGLWIVFDPLDVVPQVKGVDQAVRADVPANRQVGEDGRGVGIVAGQTDKEIGGAVQ